VADGVLGGRPSIRELHREVMAMIRFARTATMFAPVLLLLLAAGACGDDDGVSDGVPTGPVTVQVYFLNEPNFNVGTEPYVTPVEREVDAADAERGALDALFVGPTAAEQDEGLRFVASEATGFADLEIADDIARVRLTGGCSSGGSTFTVANEIVPTLKQFSEVGFVKILDPDGNTEEPEGQSDSIPECLEP
jgi:hypothetical protein